jgi:pseudaminic acid cytidylyltransferase
MNRIAIIPARGGSKRIPRKNIKSFLGRPMISYPIRCLEESGVIDRVIVSTDDEEIAEIAIKEGAEVPFVRPPELSGDHVGTMPVVRHAIDWLSDHENKPDYVCCVYATTPLIEERFIRQGYELLQNSDAKFAVSVTSFDFPIQRSIRIKSSGGLEPFYPEYIRSRSQDLEKAYHDAGQFYWGKADAFLDGHGVFSEYSSPVILPRYLVQDIDDEEDWMLAELLYRTIHDSSLSRFGE